MNTDKDIKELNKRMVEGFLKSYSIPPEKVHPDDKGTEEKRSIYCWEDVEKCMEDRIEAVPNRLPCPICGKPSEELHWIAFSTPQWTWENLMGRMGAMSICTDCHCQVEFMCMLMN